MEKEVVLQKVANNTEVAISEFFEKLYHLIIDSEDKIIKINLRTYTAYYILTKFEKLLKQNLAK